MRTPKLIAAAVMFVFAPMALSAYDVGETDDDVPAGQAGTRPPEHDVACTLLLPRGADLEAGSSVDVILVVRNRTTSVESGVTISLSADVGPDAPLWSRIVALRGRKRIVRRVHVDVPAGANSLTALVTSAADENSGNDSDSVPVGESVDAPTFARIGALLAANCVRCHHGPAAPNGIRLGTYGGASFYAVQALGAMRDGVMPRIGSVSTAKIDLFEAWVRGGKQR